MPVDMNVGLWYDYNVHRAQKHTYKQEEKTMIKNINFTAKDKVNAQGSSASLKDYAGQTIHIIGAAIDTATDVETGEVKNVAYLVADNNGSRAVISTISATAMDCIDAIIDYMTDEDATSVDAVVNSRKSNGGREFLTLTVV